MKAEITVILYKAQIKYLKSQGVWPAEFEDIPMTADSSSQVPGEEEERTTLKLSNMRLANSEEQEDADDEQEEDGEEYDSCEEIFKNTNRYTQIGGQVFCFSQLFPFLAAVSVGFINTFAYGPYKCHNFR